MQSRNKRRHGSGTVFVITEASGYRVMVGKLRYQNRVHYAKRIGLGHNPTTENLAAARAEMERRIAVLRGEVIQPSPFRPIEIGPSQRINARPAISKAKRFDVRERCDFACAYCGRRPPEVALHVDHIVPIARGGTNDDANLTAACSDCNQGKKAKLLREQQGGYGVA
jgi:hypothetical protein